MSDLRISQLPAAAVLTGAEVIELVQQGANVQLPISALAAGATQFSILGGPTTAINGALNNQFAWALATGVNFNGGGTHTLYTNNSGAGGLSGIVMPHNANFSTTAPTPTGTTLGGTVGGSTYFALGAHTNGLCYLSTNIATTTGTSPTAIVRAASNGLPVAGFTFTGYIFFNAVGAGMSFFMGFTSAAMPVAQGTAVSSLLNSLGLGIDAGDTNFSFYYNSGAGSATKVGLSITPASVLNHLMRLTITCDGLGNCTLQLVDFDNNNASSSLSLPTNTAALPAANQLLTWTAFIDNNATATTLSFGMPWGFFTFGFGSL